MSTADFAAACVWKIHGAWTEAESKLPIPVPRVREDNPARAVDAFVEELDLVDLGFEQAEPANTGQPAYHPRRSALQIYIYALFL